jgi:aspartate/methionine/tyrosine aminotransferase
VYSSAPYLEWAKTRRVPANDLAGSNLLHCTVDELPGAREHLSFSGPNEHGYQPLLAAIAGHYAVDEDRVALAGGASGANFLAMAALVQPGDEVLIERPGYDPLAAAAQAVGARVTRFERTFAEGWQLDPDRIRRALTPATRLVVVTNPHNPSGAFSEPPLVAELARLAERAGIVLLCDEVYLDIVFDRPRVAAATLSDWCISTASLTKAYGLNALRCGWAIASARTARHLRAMRGLVDGIGSAPLERLAAIAVADLPRYAARARAIVGPNAALVGRFIDGRAELEWVRPAGASLAFPRLRGVTDERPFVDRLLDDYDTAVVPGHFFDAPGHFRIASGGRRDTLERGLADIGRALDHGIHHA